jgi:hypothetical protein
MLNLVKMEYKTAIYTTDYYFFFLLRNQKSIPKFLASEPFRDILKTNLSLLFKT